MSEAFLKPIQSQKYNKSIDSNWIAHVGYDEESDLLEIVGKVS
jgi:hypothetical protein